MIARLRRLDALSNGMTKIVRTRISNTTAGRLNAAAATSRIDKSALIREGIHHVIRKVEAAGTSIADRGVAVSRDTATIPSRKEGT